MGTSSSRRMEDSDSRSRSDDGSDVDADLTTLLQYLIRSGQVHIISSENEDSEDEFMAAASPPRTEVRPNTENLDESEVSLLTKQSCGLIHTTGYKRPPYITGMISARENGMYGYNQFTQGDCRRISNWYLPNSLSLVARYRTKAFCGIYSKDGNHFVSASQDRNLRVYYTPGEQFKIVKVIQARDVGWSILDIALSPDGNHLAYSSWSESLHLCKIFNESDSQDVLSLSPDDRRFCIFALLFSSDGREILGGANDGYLYVYDLESNQRTLRIEGHDDDVNSVAFADETSHIFYSGGDDGLCKVWDRRTLNESLPNPVGVLAGHMDGITYIDPRGDSRHLITNSKDQTIKLWDVRVFSSKSGQESTKRAVADQSWDYRWQKVPRKLANCKKNLDGDTSVMTYRGHKVLQTLVRCHFSPEYTTGQRFIYTGCASGRVVIYDVLTGEARGKLTGHHACVRDVSWHPYKQEIISTSWDTTLGKWTYSGEAAEDNLMEGDLLLPCIAPRRSERIAQLQQRQQRSHDCVDRFTNTTSC